MGRPSLGKRPSLGCNGFAAGVHDWSEIVTLSLPHSFSNTCLRFMADGLFELLIQCDSNEVGRMNYAEVSFPG